MGCKKLLQICAFQDLWVLFKLLHGPDLPPELCLHWWCTGSHLSGAVKVRAGNRFVLGYLMVETDVDESLDVCSGTLQTPWTSEHWALLPASCAAWTSVSSSSFKREAQDFHHHREHVKYTLTASWQLQKLTVFHSRQSTTLIIENFKT